MGAPDIKDFTTPDGGMSDVWFRYLEGLSDPDANLSAKLDREYGSTRGMALVRGESAWLARAPTNADDVLTFDGTDTNFAAPKDFVAISAHSLVSGAVTVTDLGGYRDLHYVYLLAGASLAGTRTLELSTDNGSSWASTFFSTNGGTLTASIAVSVSSSDDLNGHNTIYGFGVASAFKTTSNTSTGTGGFFMAYTGAMNAIRFSTSAGVLDAGTLYLYGRPL